MGESAPTNCDLRLVCDLADDMPMYVNGDGNLQDGHGTLHANYHTALLNGKGVTPLKEHQKKWSFNPDGTLSLHPDGHGIQGNPADWVVGYGHNKHDKHNKSMIWVPAKDSRRLIWAFHYEPAVHGRVAV